MVYWYRGVPFKTLPFIDSSTVEHWVITDESAESKYLDDSPDTRYAIIAKKNDRIIYVEEVDAGFNSEDKLLQSCVDNYFHRKNLNEFFELDELNNKEKIEEVIL